MTTSPIPGRWALRLRTPLGGIDAEVIFAQDQDGFAGQATGRGETVPLHDITAVTHHDGERVTWTQTITRPLRLTLAFDVVIEGDALTGHSRAGRLPPSAVTGRRLPD